MTGAPYPSAGVPDDGAAAPAERERAERDHAERAAIAAVVVARNAARRAEHEHDVAQHRAARRLLLTVTVLLVVVEAVVWGFALAARARALSIEDPEARLEAFRGWTVAVGPHWVVLVSAVALLCWLWWRHLRRGPVAPLLDIVPGSEEAAAHRHPAFGPDASARRRII